MVLKRKLKSAYFFCLKRYHIIHIAVESDCEIAGWGATETKRSSNTLLWAKVPIRNVTECRVKAFIYFLKKDLHKMTGKKRDAMLTWKNLEKLGGSKTSFRNKMDTFNYRIIDDTMHICAGDNKTDSCQVITKHLNLFLL